MHAAIASRLLDFWREFHQCAPPAARGTLSVRDLLAWVTFINTTTPALGALRAYAHGACLTLLDGIGLGVGVPPAALVAVKQRCHKLLQQQLCDHESWAVEEASGVIKYQGVSSNEAATPDGQWGIPPFFVARGPNMYAAGPAFEFKAPTTARNAFRLLRALQVG